MSYPHDLLEQADGLANKDRRRLKQASLRRAISSAYYALFHLIIEDSASSLAPPAPSGLRRIVRRAFQHASMKAACRDFIQANAAIVKSQNSQLPSAVEDMLAFPFEPDFLAVLRTFVEIQDARHKADYDLTEQWNRKDVLKHIRIVRNAFKYWSNVRKTPNAAVFMTSLLLRKDWGR